MQVTVQSQSLGAPKPDDKKKKGRGSKKAPLISEKRPVKQQDKRAIKPKKPASPVPTEEPELQYEEQLEETPVTGFGDLRPPEPEEPVFDSEHTVIPEETTVEESSEPEPTGESELGGEKLVPEPTGEEGQKALLSSLSSLVKPTEEVPEDAPPIQDDIPAFDEDDMVGGDDVSEEDDLADVKPRGRKKANLKKRDRVKKERPVEKKKVSAPKKEKKVKVAKSPKRAKTVVTSDEVVRNYSKGFVPFIIVTTGLCGIACGICYVIAPFIL